MSEWKIKKGNTAVQDILIKDADGVALTTLAAAIEIKFHIKELETGVFLVEKTIPVANGIEVLLAAPDIGKLRLTLSDTDTNLPPKVYYMGLQIKWLTETREVNLQADGIETEKLKIIQDIVNT